MRSTTYLKALGLCLFVLFLCNSCSQEQDSDTQTPNIIFIMTDDHAYNALGAYGQRLAAVNPTPVLDELAAGGMLFTNVFCTNSICTPSRANIITGQYSQTNGVLDLDGSLKADKQYLPKELKQLGYQTAVIGKWHLKEAPEAFDYYNVLPVQGKYFDPILYTREEGESKQEINFHGGIKREVNITQYKGHSSDVITDITLDWLQTKRDPNQPFFLMHHYKAPHDNFENAERYDWLYDDIDIPEPESLRNRSAHGPLGAAAYGTSVSKRNTRRNMGHQHGTRYGNLRDRYCCSSFRREWSSC